MSNDWTSLSPGAYGADALAPDGDGWLLFRRQTDGAGRVERMAGSTFAEPRILALPALSWAHAVATFQGQSVWIAAGSEQGPSRLHRLGTDNSASNAALTLPFGACDAEACDATVHVLAADQDILRVGGRYGVHSNEASFAGFIITAGPDGTPRGSRAIDRFQDGQRPYELVVEAFAGGWVAGHFAMAAGERSGVWVARDNDAVNLGIVDPLWDRVSPALTVCADSAWLAVPESGTGVALIQVRPDFTVERMGTIGVSEGLAIDHLGLRCNADGLVLAMAGRQKDLPGTLVITSLDSSGVVRGERLASFPADGVPEHLAISADGVALTGRGRKGSAVEQGFILVL